MRDDSTWNRLKAEQREKLESWLFDENLGYVETLARVQKEFGVDATISSLGRFYRRRARERQSGEMLAAAVQANELNEMPVSADTLRAAAVKVIGKAVLKLAIEKPGQVQELAALTKLLLESQDNEIRLGRLKLAERYFHYEETAAAWDELPKLKAYLEAVGADQSLDDKAKLERVQAILFGAHRRKNQADGNGPPKNGK
jgi:hypothetical protein